MPNKTLFDISSENLDLFFAHELEKITPQAKSDLPKDVAFKLYRGGGKLNTKSSSRLSFAAKLYILWKCLNKRWWVLIEDEEQGITPGQFMELRKAYRKKDYTPERANVLSSYGTMVLANKELAECLTYLNRLSSGPAYNYVMKGKNTVPKNPTTEDAKERSYIIKFLINYEAQKKNIVSGTNLLMSELYVLMLLYDGKEVPTSWIYKEKLKRAYQSSPRKIKSAFGTLQARGLAVKTGVIRGATLQITAAGKDLLNSIMEKHMLNP